jgi:hypothetical protein
MSTHVPVPLHLSATYRVSLEQEAAAHIVSNAYSLHAWFPSQEPSRLHDAAPSSGHSSSGSLPSAYGSQRPGTPSNKQFSQAPLHLDSQQTPSVQKLLRQSPSFPHGRPFFRRQTCDVVLHA